MNAQRLWLPTLIMLLGTVSNVSAAELPGLAGCGKYLPRFLCCTPPDYCPKPLPRFTARLLTAATTTAPSRCRCGSSPAREFAPTRTAQNRSPASFPHWPARRLAPPALLVHAFPPNSFRAVLSGGNPPLKKRGMIRKNDAQRTEVESADSSSVALGTSCRAIGIAAIAQPSTAPRKRAHISCVATSGRPCASAVRN